MTRDAAGTLIGQGSMFISYIARGPDGSMAQCLARDLKVASSILAHGSFLMRGIALSR